MTKIFLEPPNGQNIPQKPLKSLKCPYNHQKKQNKTLKDHWMTKMSHEIFKMIMLFLKTSRIAPNILKWTKISYNIGCGLKSTTLLNNFFYQRWILTNPPLDYIFFLYPTCSKSFRKLNNSYVIDKLF